MPRKNGLQVVEEVKALYEQANQNAGQQKRIKKPLFIFCSAYISNHQFITFCKQKGVQYVFEKPLQDDKLIELHTILDQA